MGWLHLCGQALGKPYSSSTAEIFIDIKGSKLRIIHVLLNCREDPSAAAGLSCAGPTPKHATPGV